MLDLVRQGLSMPMWARLSAEGPGTISAYYRGLSEHFPVIISSSPLIFLVVLLRKPRLGGLLLAWFGVPLFLHSLVFPWKLERYVLLAIPALLLAAGIAASEAAVALQRYLEKRLHRYLPGNLAGRSATIFTCLIAVAVLITTPAFNTARRSIHQRVSNGWAESVKLLEKNPALARLPIGSAQPLVALHYWGRLDFTVQRDTVNPEFDTPYLMKPMGSPDVYAGRPTLTTPEAIRSRFAPRGGVIIGVDEKYLAYRNIEPALAEILTNEAEELCHGRCGSMRLFHWSFGPARTD